MIHNLEEGIFSTWETDIENVQVRYFPWEFISRLWYLLSLRAVLNHFFFLYRIFEIKSNYCLLGILVSKEG